MKAQSPRFKSLLIVAVLASALVLPPSPRSSAQQPEARGINVVSIRTEDGREVRLYDKSYALVVGVGDYTAGWPKLPGVRPDVEAVSAALERHGFRVTVVLNPDHTQLDKSFKDFISAHGRNVENRLLFYFAGHGHTVEQSYGEEMGYIVPTDAPNPNKNQNGFLDRALSMRQIELYAESIQSKHALFLFDSCFSGQLFALSRAVPESISYKTTRHVRQFITSGSAEEQVPDRSIFRRQFVEALEGEGDVNKDGYVTGTELGEFLQDKVVNYSRSAQHPQYGKIRNPNLDKGDFVFALPTKTTSAPAVAANNATTAQPTQPARVDPAAIELAFWDTVKNSTDPEDFKDYLSKYPKGLYAGIASRKIAALTSAPKPAPTTPPTGSAAPNTTGLGRASGPKPGSVTRNRMGIELVYVPPGEFMMGSENGESDEKPIHRVTIREGFWMGKYEVTQALWRAVMGNNPAHFKGCDTCPVESVSWKDAQRFISKLNSQNDGYTYRLPSEAEWEYAARAGMGADWSLGQPLSLAQAKSDNNLLSKEQANWLFCKGGECFGNNKTTPVGSYPANGFGLYDMHGNVGEWVQDYHHANYIGAPADGSAWTGGVNSQIPVMRGGAWSSLPYYTRASSRSAMYGGMDANNVDLTDAFNEHNGFRIVAVPRT